MKNIKSTTDNVPELCALYIPINANAELIIENRASGNEPVGELIATGGYHSAGIGQASASTDPTHKFIINSGIITANGDTYAAGIGASHGKTYLGKITINGGLVFANLIGDAANYRGNQNTDEMLTLSDEEFKYDGLPKTFSFVMVKKDDVTYSHEGEKPDYTVVYTNNTDAATADSENAPTITIMPTAKGLLFGDPVFRKFSIAKESSSPNMFSFTKPEDMTYDGNRKEVTIYCGTQTGFKAVYFDNAGLQLTEAPTQAGDYTFKIDLENNPNFEPVTGLIENPEVWKFTIERREPTFATWRINNKSFDATPISGIIAPVLNGITTDGVIDTNGLLSYTYYYKDNEDWVATTAENAGAAAEGDAPVWGGSYKVVATFARNTNYATKETEATFSITRVAPRFEAFNVPHYAVYDGTAKRVTATVKGVENDAAVYQATIAYAKKNAEGQYVALADGVQPIEAGEYQATATFEDRNYTLISNTMPFAIQTKQLTEEMITLNKKEFFYNEETQQPTVTVKVGETVLREGTDYTVNRPTESKKIGKYELTVIGKGNYEGEVKVEYQISAVPQVPYYTVVIPESVRGAVLIGGGTQRQERNSYIDFRIELDPNGGGTYPRVTVSGTGKTFTPDANGNYRLQVTCDTYVLIDEITDYSYYVLSCPRPAPCRSTPTAACPSVWLVWQREQIALRTSTPASIW